MTQTKSQAYSLSQTIAALLLLPIIWGVVAVAAICLFILALVLLKYQDYLNIPDLVAGYLQFSLAVLAGVIGSAAAILLCKKLFRRLNIKFVSYFWGSIHLLFCLLLIWAFFYNIYMNFYVSSYAHFILLPTFMGSFLGIVLMYKPTDERAATDQSAVPETTKI